MKKVVLYRLSRSLGKVKAYNLCKLDIPATYHSTYLRNINRLSKEIEAIKSAECIMDYDSKTKIIEDKLKKIEQYSIMNTTLASAEL